MSFGSPTPVEIAISGPNLPTDQEYAVKVRDALKQIRTLRDIQFGQSFDYPTVQVNINRQRAGLMGLTTTDITRSTVAATFRSLA